MGPICCLFSNFLRHTNIIECQLSSFLLLAFSGYKFPSKHSFSFITLWYKKYMCIYTYIYLNYHLIQNSFMLPLSFFLTHSILKVHFLAFKLWGIFLGYYFIIYFNPLKFIPIALFPHEMVILVNVLYVLRKNVYFAVIKCNVLSKSISSSLSY